MSHISGKDPRGFFLLSWYLKSDVLAACSGKPLGKGGSRERRQSRKTPSRLTLVYPNIQGVLDISFFSFLFRLPSDAMQNCQAKGGCRWKSSPAPGSLCGRARKLLTLNVLDERHGAVALSPEFPIGWKAPRSSSSSQRKGSRRARGKETALS